VIRPKHNIPLPILAQISIGLVLLRLSRSAHTHGLPASIDYSKGAGRVEAETLDGGRGDMGALENVSTAFRKGYPNVFGGLLEYARISRRAVSLGRLYR